ncbi:MAG: TOBE domain-containing protein [Natronomonas sp.]
MDSTDGRARPVLVADDVEFDGRDASLFREIARTGSVARASSNLGRSRARALTRIETLEAAFGELVDRQRGGQTGGGSRLSENANQLLDRFDRVRAAVTASAQVPETVLRGSIATVTGELAEVETALGTVRGRHDGIREGDPTQVRIGADAITVLDPGADPEPNATSARNRFAGRVTDVDRGETVHVVTIDVYGIPVRALVTEESTVRMELHVGRDVAITWKATATRLVPASRS